MMRTTASRFIIGSLAPIAMIMSVPASADDPRLQTLVYDEGVVVPISGRVKVLTTIKFAEDEVIENVAIGDSQAWQIQPNKARTTLFVKPLAQSAKTNLTVVTSKRTYLFDLVASPRNRPLYVMQFRYPELERAKEEARLAALEEQAKGAANAAELAASSDPYAVLDPSKLNFEWEADGKRSLLPSQTYDNGDAVFLLWPEGTPVPAILAVNEEGDEGPVNYTVRGETVIVDQVPPQIILRNGKDTATLTNNGPVRVSTRDQGAETNGRGS
ncbi:MAG: TrbG/VirB9 family P-type conjugative transfer protein [Pseudomonadota bacterium]